MERWSKWLLVCVSVWGVAFAQSVGVLDALACEPVGGRLVCGDAMPADALPGGSVLGGVDLSGVSRDDLAGALSRAAVDAGAWFDVGVLEFALGSFGEAAGAFEFVDDSLAARVNAGVAWVLAGDARGRVEFEGLLGDLREWSFVEGLYGVGEPLVVERWSAVVSEVVWRFAVAFLRVGDARTAFDVLGSFAPPESLRVVWRDASLLAGWLVLPVGEFVPFVRSLGLSGWLEALWLGRGFVRAGNLEYAAPHYGVVWDAVSGGVAGLPALEAAGVLGEVSRFLLASGRAAEAVLVGEESVRVLAGGEDALVFASLAVAHHANEAFGDAVVWYERALGVPEGEGGVPRLRLLSLLAFALEGVGDARAREVTRGLLVDADFVTLPVRDQVAVRVLRAHHLRVIRGERPLSRVEESELGALVGGTVGLLGSLSVPELLALADATEGLDPRLTASVLSTAASLEGASERVRGRLLRHWWVTGEWGSVRDALSVWLLEDPRAEWFVYLGGAFIMLDDIPSAREAWVAAVNAGAVGVSEWLVLLGGE